MQATAPVGTTKRTNPQIPIVLFGIGIAALVLYLITFTINLHGENAIILHGANDFYKEAWPAYLLLQHGHIVAFLRDGPAYVGSLILRVPFALLAGALGAGQRAMYIVTGLPCLLAPALLAGYLAANRPGEPAGTASNRVRRGIRPIDLFMVTPPAIVCLADGHPEDIFGAVLCVLAVLLAQRGSGRAAGFALGVALINKSWAVVVVPLVFAVMPADRRLSSFITLVVTAGIVLIPITVIRATAPGGAGAALGDQSAGIFMVPQLLWWLDPNSWIVREAHILLVAVDWSVTGAWWWLRVRGRSQPPRVNDALMALALVFFLRAALDPWDNIYYLGPFMLTLMTYEEPPGFPKLSWLYSILIVVIVPQGLLGGLNQNAHAAVFAVFAVLTIAWFGWRAFFPDRPMSGRIYAAASRSPS
jgi:hypothetical protein